MAGLRQPCLHFRLSEQMCSLRLRRRRCFASWMTSPPLLALRLRSRRCSARWRRGTRREAAAVAAAARALPWTSWRSRLPMRF
jgi:hypothetical protein